MSLVTFGASAPQEAAAHTWSTWGLVSACPFGTALARPTEGPGGVSVLLFANAGPARVALAPGFLLLLELLQKNCEFHKSEGTGHAGCQNDAVPEAAKIDTSIRILIFEKN